jgi:membrane-bound serine protease (ClpP class)
MKQWFAFLFLLFSWIAAPQGAVTKAVLNPEKASLVYVIPIREDIMPPLVYLVRRGVKEAMEANADLLVLDMDTNGGRVDVTEEIIQILNQFKGQTATYVNRKAFSAGAFISVATQKIYMAPQSVIGAAAPIMLSPGGTGVEKTTDTFEAKITSGISALVRTCAEKNGHNKAVVDAMIDKNKNLVIDGEVINQKGEILTLTNIEAEKNYGNPPKPLLSLGTRDSLEDVLKELGYAGARRVDVRPTGAEQVATWINAISPILLIIGIVGVYIEFKTPGFGIPGIVGVLAFAVYFLGGYVGGLSGLEWAAIFFVGMVLVILEIFVFPGTVVLGALGAALMFLGLIMAMVDVYPGMPAIPSLPQLKVPLQGMAMAIFGSLAVAWILSRFLPRTTIYSELVSHSASGVTSVEAAERVQKSRMGQVGVAVSILRPGGKARFGEEIIDVITQGEMIEPGAAVRVVDHSAAEAIVERA